MPRTAVPRSASPRISTYSDAPPRVLSHAQSFSFGPLAVSRWRSESMDVMAADGTGSTVSHVLRLERPHLARAIQSVSDRTRRPSPDGIALYRTESCTGRSGGSCGRLAMVECPCVEGLRARSSSGSRTCGSPAAVAQVGERADVRGGGSAGSAERESQRTIRIGTMECSDSNTVRA